MKEQDRKLDELCINTLRMLSVDMVEAAKSGHPGLPLGAAAIPYVLWTRLLRHNPANPSWPNRDRFILSAGHGSMLLYTLLHLSGFGMPKEELMRFRRIGSLTPGHPEYGHTVGVETTTGPLGAGFATAVGMAMAEKKLALVISLETDRLKQEEKGEIAQFTMDVGLHTAAVDNPSRQIARDMRYIAAVALAQRKWASATDLVIEHFDTVLLEYDRGVTDKRRVVEAIDCLGAMRTHEAAVRLTQYLVLLNSYTERLREFDNSIVLVVIENLGSLGDKTAFDDLLYAQYLSYSSEIKKAVRDALENLKW